MTTKELLAVLEAAQPLVERRDIYFRGVQPLRFMADSVDRQVAGFTANLARVAVAAVAERIVMQDVSAMVRGRDVSDRARQLVRDADLPMVLQSVFVDMLALGSAFLIVWVDGQGRPVVTGESARQVAVVRDPVTRGVSAAVKRWTVCDAAGVVTAEHVVKYLPDRIVHLVRDDSRGTLSFVSQVDNPLGVVPVVPLVNVERIHDDQGMSVVDDVAPLLDALNKVFSDMLTTSEAVARPKRWATGVALEDDTAGFSADGDGFSVDDGGGDDVARSPFKDSDDLWVAEESEARFGQLAGAGMGGYKTAVDLIVQQIMAVTALPAHMVGITTSNPATAEALRASEVALAARAASRIRVVNRPLEWALRLLVAADQGVPPGDVEVALSWRDPATRSVAAEADAAAKLAQANIVSTSEARQSVGVTEEV